MVILRVLTRPTVGTTLDLASRVKKKKKLSAASAAPSMPVIPTSCLSLVGQAGREGAPRACRVSGVFSRSITPPSHLCSPVSPTSIDSPEPRLRFALVCQCLSSPGS